MTLETLWSDSGAAGWGTVAFADLLPHMSEVNRARAQSLCPGAAGVFMAAFPYYAGDEPGNLSLYARGEDYHGAVVRRLSGVCRGLSGMFPDRHFFPAADTSPIPEKEAFALAGLGLRGRNTLSILPPWGSWLFLGSILTDLPLSSAPLPAPDCLNCNRCVSACPSGALSASGLNPKRCLSDLTQRKGGLTEEEEALLRRHPLIWGCDLCQRVCPYNQDAALTPLPEFRKNLISSLSGLEVDGLTNRQFREKYAGRAFNWRGPAVLQRNWKLMWAGE